jgi:hypothetical protein
MTPRIEGRQLLGPVSRWAERINPTVQIRCGISFAFIGCILEEFLLTAFQMASARNEEPAMEQPLNILGPAPTCLSHMTKTLYCWPRSSGDSESSKWGLGQTAVYRVVELE